MISDKISPSVYGCCVLTFPKCMCDRSPANSPLIFCSRLVVYMFLTITQIGFCCIYVLFVGKNLEQVGNIYWIYTH